METVSQNTRPIEARLSQVTRVDVQLKRPEPLKTQRPDDGQSGQLAEPQTNEQLVQKRAELASAKVTVSIDAASGRFVNTLVNSSTDEILRKYPSEQQLAYSRAVKAYLKATSGH